MTLHQLLIMMGHGFQPLSITAAGTEKRQINLAGRFYTLAINRRQNAHRMTMRIRDRNISLTIPFGINDAEINHFLAANQEWIDAQIADQENALADALPGQGKTPMIYYKGVPTEIILIRDPSHQNRSKIEPGLNSLTIYMHAESRLRPVKVLENHLRQEARQLIGITLTGCCRCLVKTPSRLPSVTRKPAGAVVHQHGGFRLTGVLSCRRPKVSNMLLPTKRCI